MQSSNENKISINNYIKGADRFPKFYIAEKNTLFSLFHKYETMLNVPLRKRLGYNNSKMVQETWENILKGFNEHPTTSNKRTIPELKKYWQNARKGKKYQIYLKKNKIEIGDEISILRSSRDTITQTEISDQGEEEREYDKQAENKEYNKSVSKQSSGAGQGFIIKEIRGDSIPISTNTEDQHSINSYSLVTPGNIELNTTRSTSTPTSNSTDAISFHQIPITQQNQQVQSRVQHYVHQDNEHPQQKNHIQSQYSICKHCPNVKRLYEDRMNNLRIKEAEIRCRQQEIQMVKQKVELEKEKAELIKVKTDLHQTKELHKLLIEHMQLKLKLLKEEKYNIKQSKIE